MRLSELLKQYREGGVNDPYVFKAVFMAGGPGSGKSFIAKELFEGLGVKFLNSDIPFEYLLKKRKLSLNIDPRDVETYAKQQEAREWAKRLSELSKAKWLNGMLGLVIDGTGANYDYIKEIKTHLYSIGYDTSMVFVNTSLDVALQRNQLRERTVPEKIVTDSWNAVQSNMGKFQNLFGTSDFLLVDNSEVHKGEKLQKLGMNLRKSALKLLNKPLRNHVGVKTLLFLRQIGGKTLQDIQNYVKTYQGKSSSSPT